MNIKGPLTESNYYILLSLRNPNHGYGIIQEVEKITKERVRLGPGTLYGAINSMLKKNWIKLYSEDKSSRKKKEYVITKIGIQVLEFEIIRLKELIKNAKLLEDKYEKSSKDGKFDLYLDVEVNESF